MAIDAARMLLRPSSDLAATDVADHALSALQESNIRYPIQSQLSQLFYSKLRAVQGATVTFRPTGTCTWLEDEDQFKLLALQKSSERYWVCHVMQHDICNCDTAFFVVGAC